MTSALAIQAHDPNFLEEIKTATSEDLRRLLADSLRLTAERLVFLGAIVQELERRGEDLANLKLGMMRWLRGIASGQLLPEIVVRYSGKQRLLERIAALPVEQQRVLVENPTVPLVVGSATKHVDALAIPYQAIDQVFGDGTLHDAESQQIYLASRRPRKSKQNAPAAKRLRCYPDRENDGIRVGKSFVPKAEVVLALAALAGSLPEITPHDKDYETATVKLRPEEKGKLKILEKNTQLSEWQLIRQALRACGLI